MTKETFPGITSRNGNTLQITIRYNGKKYYETIRRKDTLQNRRIVKKLRDKVHEQLEEGGFNYRKTFPLGNNAEIFNKMKGDHVTIGQRLDDRVKLLIKKQLEGKIERSTLNGNKKEIAACDSEFGDMYLSELTTDLIEDWIERTNVTNDTASNRLGHLRAISKIARKNREIEDNIFIDWSPDVFKLSEYVNNPFTANEYIKIMKSIKKVAPDAYTFFLFRFALGMRPCEIFGLQWTRYNEKTNSIFIKETIVDGEKKPTPKTKAGIRTIELNDLATRAINEQKKITKGEHELIFTNPNTGNHWTYGPISMRWRKALKDAGVPYREPYNTRHTFATLLIKTNEVGLYALSTILGHKDIATTTSIYIGAAGIEVNSSANALNKVFKK